eukprot:TRINITY_DN73317_c0_g1_i1.p1 TRINITY_DN73317_c0_g1~~TRINITY_DN73317_c0_g1_i1.p1  ORF type:complete len:1869 (-),score=349.24 TRINITY_DN73317_c0_g1_i1:51-5657(-)
MLCSPRAAPANDQSSDNRRTKKLLQQNMSEFVGEIEQKHIGAARLKQLFGEIPRLDYQEIEGGVSAELMNDTKKLHCEESHNLAHQKAPEYGTPAITSSSRAEFDLAYKETSSLREHADDELRETCSQLNTKDRLLLDRARQAAEMSELGAKIAQQQSHDDCPQNRVREENQLDAQNFTILGQGRSEDAGSKICANSEEDTYGPELSCSSLLLDTESHTELTNLIEQFPSHGAENGGSCTAAIAPDPKSRFKVHGRLGAVQAAVTAAAARVRAKAKTKAKTKAVAKARSEAASVNAYTPSALDSGNLARTKAEVAGCAVRQFPVPALDATVSQAPNEPAAGESSVTVKTRKLARSMVQAAGCNLQNEVAHRTCIDGRVAQKIRPPHSSETTPGLHATPPRNRLASSDSSEKRRGIARLPSLAFDGKACQAVHMLQKEAIAQGRHMGEESAHSSKVAQQGVREEFEHGVPDNQTKPDCAEDMDGALPTLELQAEAFKAVLLHGRSTNCSLCENFLGDKYQSGAPDCVKFRFFCLDQETLTQEVTVVEEGQTRQPQALASKTDWSMDLEETANDWQVGREDRACNLEARNVKSPSCIEQQDASAEGSEAVPDCPLLSDTAFLVNSCHQEGYHAEQCMQDVLQEASHIRFTPPTFVLQPGASGVETWEMDVQQDRKPSWAELQESSSQNDSNEAKHDMFRCLEELDNFFSRASHQDYCQLESSMKQAHSTIGDSSPTVVLEAEESRCLLPHKDGTDQVVDTKYPIGKVDTEDGEHNAQGLEARSYTRGSVIDETSRGFSPLMCDSGGLIADGEQWKVHHSASCLKADTPKTVQEEGDDGTLERRHIEEDMDVQQNVQHSLTGAQDISTQNSTAEAKDDVLEYSAGRDDSWLWSSGPENCPLEPDLERVQVTKADVFPILMLESDRSKSLLPQEDGTDLVFGDMVTNDTMQDGEYTSYKVKAESLASCSIMAEAGGDSFRFMCDSEECIAEGAQRDEEHLACSLKTDLQKTAPRAPDDRVSEYTQTERGTEVQGNTAFSCLQFQDCSSDKGRIEAKDDMLTCFAELEHQDHCHVEPNIEDMQTTMGNNCPDAVYMAEHSRSLLIHGNVTDQMLGRKSADESVELQVGEHTSNSLDAECEYTSHSLDAERLTRGSIIDEASRDYSLLMCDREEVIAESAPENMRSSCTELPDCTMRKGTSEAKADMLKLSEKLDYNLLRSLHPEHRQPEAHMEKGRSSMGVGSLNIVPGAEQFRCLLLHEDGMEQVFDQISRDDIGGMQGGHCFEGGSLAQGNIMDEAGRESSPLMCENEESIVEVEQQEERHSAFGLMDGAEKLAQGELGDDARESMYSEVGTDVHENMKPSFTKFQDPIMRKGTAETKDDALERSEEPDNRLLCLHHQECGKPGPNMEEAQSIVGHEPSVVVLGVEQSTLLLLHKDGTDLVLAETSAIHTADMDGGECTSHRSEAEDLARHSLIDEASRDSSVLLWDREESITEGEQQREERLEFILKSAAGEVVQQELDDAAPEIIYTEGGADMQESVRYSCIELEDSSKQRGKFEAKADMLEPSEELDDSLLRSSHQEHCQLDSSVEGSIMRVGSQNVVRASGQSRSHVPHEDGIDQLFDEMFLDDIGDTQDGEYTSHGFEAGSLARRSIVDEAGRDYSLLMCESDHSMAEAEQQSMHSEGGTETQENMKCSCLDLQHPIMRQGTAEAKNDVIDRSENLDTSNRLVCLHHGYGQLEASTREAQSAVGNDSHVVPVVLGVEQSSILLPHEAGTDLVFDEASAVDTGDIQDGGYTSHNSAGNWKSSATKQSMPASFEEGLCSDVRKAFQNKVSLCFQALAWATAGGALALCCAAAIGELAWRMGPEPEFFA